MTDPIREAIRDRALASGFDAVGFAAAHLDAEARAGLGEFIARGYHGDMGWLAGTAARRGDPQALWPNARSVVVLGVNYAPEGNPLALAERRDCGVVSVYARGRDYHDTLKRRLKALAHWIEERWPGALKLFVDTAPVMEKPLAERAGLGWQGKHTNLVSRQFGSWLFLGEIYLSLELEPDAPERDRCGSCRRCLDVCPTAAFPAPHRLDARRCISYLTIEHKGMIPIELRPLIGNRIYGCDDCQDVCPWNRFAVTTGEKQFHPRKGNLVPELAALVDLTPEEFARRFKDSPIRRAKRDGFVRNVVVALGNSRRSEAVPALGRALRDASALVRAHAAWALGQIGTPEALRLIEDSRPSETDPQVREEMQLALVPPMTNDQ